MKISQVGAELFHAGKYDEAKSRFSQILQMRPTMRVKCHGAQSALLKLQQKGIFNSKSNRERRESYWR
jgi:hypothetical protein